MWFFFFSSVVLLCFRAEKEDEVLGREEREADYSRVLQGDRGQSLSFDHGQATSIWVPCCQGHSASLLSTSDVKLSTGDMSAKFETWTQLE